MARIQPMQGARVGIPWLDALMQRFATPEVGPGPMAVNLGAPTFMKPLLPGTSSIARFPLMESGKPVGEALVSRLGKMLRIENIGSETPLALRDLRTMLQQIVKLPEFQGVERVGGTRISGMGGQKVQGGIFKLGQELDLPISRFLAP